MSEPKLISPMLDNFVMGDPISDHHGIKCCPAMQNDSDKKYIVKIISIPASQVQLQALLLTGAYQNEDSALEYFHELSQGIVQEVEILNQLSKLEGFVSYEGCQVVAMEGAVGYEVYLLSPYRRSLERYARRHALTHLNAVNLGLDICAALAVARHKGYLYTDLKPGNIYMSDDGEFRIGDIGFVAMDSLKYASLPEKYLSPYTAPEVQDAYSALSMSMDIYAAGMVLYQVYNDGKLPEQNEDGSLPAPAYADYEMAEIILKACALNPDDRWENPLVMGQAIVDYMQRNGANNVPIVPPPPPLDIPETGTEETAEGESSDSAESGASADSGSGSADAPTDETIPDASMAEGIRYDELSDDTSDILAQADELIAHKLPEGVVAPQAIDVPIPPPIVTAPATEAKTDASAADESAETAAGAPDTASEDSKAKSIPASAEEPESEYDHYEPEDEPDPAHKKKAVRRVITTFIVLLLLAGIVVGGYLFYTRYYLQLVSDFRVEGTENQMTVYVTSDIDETLLTVVCTDIYGNKHLEAVVDGKAVFTDLNSNTLYTVKLEIEGFHKLTGDFNESYTTPAETDIISFQATTGSEDGSVILSFSVDGKDSDNWTLSYTTEGEEEKFIRFTGHMITVTGLTVGKTYTFCLGSDSPLYIVGQDTLEYTAVALVYAENLMITGCADGILNAQWSVPEGATVESWTVRCYNDSGYDISYTTTDTTAAFADLDTSLGYTVEVTAKDMTSGTRTYVSANSVTINSFTADTSKATKMTVSWDFSGTAPEGNWLLLYTIDGSTNQEVIRTDEPKAVISPIVPNATYHFVIQTEAGVDVFTEDFTVQTKKPASFEGYLVNTSHMTFRMCVNPGVENWDRDDVKKYTDTFKVGDKAAFTVRLSRNYNTSQDNITTMYVIRDENGVLVSHDTQKRTWTSMWWKYNCELEIPALPSQPGKYTIEIYFNGKYVHSQAFTVTAAE